MQNFMAWKTSLLLKKIENFYTQIPLYYQRGGTNPKGCPSVGAKGHLDPPFALQLWFVTKFLHFLLPFYQATLLDIILLNSFVHPHL
jgi:hypothetical protein